MCESKSSKGGKDANQRQIGAVQTWFVTFGFIWPSSAGWNSKPPPEDDKVVAENQLWLGFLGATFVDFPLFGMRYSSWKVSTDKFSTISVQVQFTKILCYMLSNSMYKHCFWRWPTVHHWTCSWFVEIFEGWHSEGWSKAKMATELAKPHTHLVLWLVPLWRLTWWISWLVLWHKLCYSRWATGQCKLWTPLESQTASASYWRVS